MVALAAAGRRTRPDVDSGALAAGGARQTSPAGQSAGRLCDGRSAFGTLLLYVLNARIQDLNMSVSDLHAAHRLQKDDKVICKFTIRQTRDLMTRGSG